jgi:hypothetical protein
MSSKKYFRRISLELNRSPYYVQEGKPSLLINFLINQRSHAESPLSMTRTVARHLKDVGFFKWYPGRRVNGKLIRTAPLDSLMYHAEDSFRNPIRRSLSQPCFEKPPLLGHWITIFCDNQYHSGNVRWGWCYVDTKDETIVFKLNKGKWVESHRNIKNDQDLPF